ncbi:MAG: L-threonylcarbamoyladenylate synthase [Termitinemataceae bacterium]|nr:MAG: L-threonylcarbamoyladenylate synthase [Termitinemataceae bacterium]
MMLIANEQNIAQAAGKINEGGIVAFPTETVYGLGADAFNERSVARVFNAKKRPFFDPLIVHISALNMMERLVDFSRLSLESKKKLDVLTKELMPGPLTLILPKKPTVPDITSGGLDTVAVRFPCHDVALKLIDTAGCPIAAPSANPFGLLSPTTARHVQAGLGDSVDMILDGGPCRIGIESTVLDICGGKAAVLRQGGTEQDAIEALIGKCCATPHDPKITSPGCLKSHYAPKSKLILYAHEDFLNIPLKDDASYLFFDKASMEKWEKRQETNKKNYSCSVLSLQSNKIEANTIEAASNLFQTLHIIDAEKPSCIYAQAAPHLGLGPAINDRLQRASVSANL